MYLKPITPYEAVPVLGSDISLATVVSVMNNSGAPCVIRVNNGEAANDQPSVVLATGERATIAKDSWNEIYAEDLNGSPASNVYATKVAYGN